MAIVEVTVLPLGTGSPGMSDYVADILRVLESSKDKIRYQLNPMGTILEGDLNDILEIIKRMHEQPFEKGALRVNTILRIDERRDKPSTLEQKMKSVQEKLEN